MQIHTLHLHASFLFCSYCSALIYSYHSIHHDFNRIHRHTHIHTYTKIHSYTCTIWRLPRVDDAKGASETAPQWTYSIRLLLHALRVKSAAAATTTVKAAVTFSFHCRWEMYVKEHILPVSRSTVLFAIFAISLQPNGLFSFSSIKYRTHTLKGTSFYLPLQQSCLSSLSVLLYSLLYFSLPPCNLR